MRETMVGLVLLAALSFFAVGFNDQYQAPRTLALALAAFPLLFIRSGMGCTLTRAISWGALAWAAAAAFGYDFWYSMVGTYINPFDSFTCVAVYAAVVIGVAKSEVSEERVAELVCLAALPMLVYAVVQKFLPHLDPFLPSELPTGGRVVSTQGAPVYVGAAAAVVLACSLRVIETRRRLGVAAALLCAATIWASGSRAGAVGACAALMVWTRSAWLRGVLALLPLGVLLVKRSQIGDSDLGRLAVWDISLSMFRDHWLTGVGPGNFAVVSRRYITPEFVQAHGSDLISAAHAHSEVLQVAATCGVVGLIAYVILAAASVRAAIESRERRLLLSALAAYVVVAGLNPTSHAPVIVVAALIGAASQVQAPHAPKWFSRGLAGACFLAACLAGRVAAGDWHYVKGILYKNPVAKAIQFERAASWNPWEVRIIDARINSALVVLRGAPPDKMAHGIQALVDEARLTLSRHPYDSHAFEMYGRMLLIAASAGIQSDPLLAMAHYERAQELAPTFTPLMRRRIATAKILGLDRMRRQAEADLARMTQGRS